jgi:hypothetical protein
MADGEGVLRVQSAENDLSLVPASSVSKTVEKAKDTLEDAIGAIMPALSVVTGKLRKLSPDELTVEFGLVLGAESGVVVAKGHGEVHFTVTLGWKNGAAENNSAAATVSGQDGGG